MNTAAGAWADTTRLSRANLFGDTKFTERNWTILDTLEQLAAEMGRPMEKVALAWTLACTARCQQDFTVCA